LASNYPAYPPGFPPIRPNPGQPLSAVPRPAPQVPEADTRPELEQLLDDHDFLAIPEPEARTIFRAVAERDQDFASALPHEQVAFEDFAVKAGRAQRRAALAQQNAPLAESLYEPGIAQDVIQPMQQAAVARHEAVAASPLAQPFKEQWVDPTVERVKQGAAMAAPFLSFNTPSFSQGPAEPPMEAVKQAGMAALGGLTAASAPGVPFEQAAGQAGALAGFTEEGALPSIRALGGIAGGTVGAGAMAPGPLRTAVSELVGIGDIGVGQQAATARIGGKFTDEPLDATFGRFAMEKEQAAAAAAAEVRMAQRAAQRAEADALASAQRSQSAAGGVMQTPQGPVGMPPQAPADAAGVLVRGPEQIPLQPKQAVPESAPPLEGEYIQPVKGFPEPEKGFPAQVTSEAIPDRPLLPSGAQATARGGDIVLPPAGVREGMSGRPGWLDQAIEEARTEIVASRERIKGQRGSAPDVVEGAKNTARLATIGAGVLWDLGAAGGQNFGRFKKAMLEAYPELAPKDWHGLYAKSRTALAAARFRMTASEFEALYGQGEKIGGPEWYREAMDEAAKIIDALPQATEIDNRKLQAMLHSGFSPQQSVKQATIQALDATEDLITGQRIGTTYESRAGMSDVSGEGVVPNLPREAARGEFPSRPPKVQPFSDTLEAGLKGRLGTAKEGGPPAVIDRHSGAMLFGEEAEKTGFRRTASQMKTAQSAIEAMARRKGLGTDQLQAGTWVPYVEARTGAKDSYQPWSKTFREQFEARGGMDRIKKLDAQPGVFDEMVKRIEDPEQGAFSYDFVEGRFIEVGKDDKYIVSMYPERSVYLPEGARITRDTLRKYANANRDLLDRDVVRTSIDGRMSDAPIPRHVVGAWKGSDGRYYLDINAASDSREAAEAVGRAYDQEGIFGSLKGEFVSTGGTGAGLDAPVARTPLTKRARELKELETGALRTEDFTEIREGRVRDWISKLGKQATKAQKRFEARLAETPLKNRRGSGSVYTDEDLRDLSIIGAYKLAEAGDDAAKWAKAMTDEYPQLAPDTLDKILKGARTYEQQLEEKHLGTLKSRPAPKPAPRAIPSARGRDREAMDVPERLATKSLDENVSRSLAKRWKDSGHTWDKDTHPQISDQIAADLAEGTVDIGDWAATLREEGISLEDFGRNVFKGTYSEAGRKLNQLAKITRDLDKLMTDDEVLGRAVRNLDDLDAELRKIDGIC
jgi:hypothetical protein